MAYSVNTPKVCALRVVFNQSENLMNIFILSEQTDPALHYRQNAEFHCDKHVIKMIAESTQMLVTVLHTVSIPELGTYLPEYLVANMPCKPLGPAMQKHPCTQWTAASIDNFNYLACLAQALCDEHQYRYPLSPSHAYSGWIHLLVSYLKAKGYGPTAAIPRSFAVAVKDARLRSIGTPHLDALHTYRNYYVRDKAQFATWRKRMKPVWFMLLEESLGPTACNS